MAKETYNDRKSKGLCPICGDKAEDGYVTCATCRKLRREKNYAKAHLCKCANCNSLHNQPSLLCEACLKKQSETKRKLREKRKQLHLCTRCGKPTDGVHTNCDVCRNYAKEARDSYIQYGICSRCHKEKIYGDEKMCPECRADRAIINAKYRNSHREDINRRERELHKIHYEERKAQGICTRCGKNKASEGKFTCGQCREKNNQEKRLAYVKILIDKPNRCRYCNNDSAPGYKVCEEHRQKLSESATSKNVNEARKKTKARLNW